MNKINDIRAALAAVQAIDEQRKKIESDIAELVGSVNIDEVEVYLKERDFDIALIDREIAKLANEKIENLNILMDLDEMFKFIGVKSNVSKLIRRPSPDFKPRYLDVVTGKTYTDPSIACQIARIKHTVASCEDDWIKSKGYPLRTVR